MWGSTAPFLAGCYEAELRSAIEAIIASGPARVVDVGAAEGYYAVGIALRLPQAMVYAFDIDRNAHEVCHEVALLNGVSERVVIREACTHEGLAELVGPGCAMIVDCEGYESELLNPAVVQGLTSTLILVELHDFVDPTISKQIRTRFAQSHDIEVFQATTRTLGTVPAVATLSVEDQKVAVDELRPAKPYPMEWMLLTPRATDEKPVTPMSAAPEVS